MKFLLEIVSQCDGYGSRLNLFRYCSFCEGHTTVTNALPAELRRNVGRPLHEITYTRCENNNFWSTFMRIQTSDLPMLLLGTLPADRRKGHAQEIISCVNDHEASNLRP